MSKISKEKKEVSINLNCYTIGFKEKENKQDVSIKNAFNGKSFLEIINGLISILDTFTNKNNDRVLFIEKVISLNDNIFSCILMKGHNGHETYVGEIDNKKIKPVSTITRQQFSYIPFYCLLSLPDKDSNRLIFLAQSYKQFGYKEVFEEFFRHFYKTKFNMDYNCEIGTLSISKLFDKYINEGDIRKMRFKKYNLTKDLANSLKNTENEKIADDYEMEISIRAKKTGFMGIKQKINLKNSTFTEIFKIDGFDYDEAYADISIGGRKRILNVTSPEKFSAAFDVTEKSKINETTNHPDFISLDLEAKVILTDEILSNLTNQ